MATNFVGVLVCLWQQIKGSVTVRRTPAAKRLVLSETFKSNMTVKMN